MTSKAAKITQPAVAFIRSHGYWAVFLIYASGFWLWNSYLLKLGFFEYDFVQIRYISAGLLLLAPPFLCLLIIYFCSKFYGHWRFLWIISLITGIVAGLWAGTVFIFFHRIPQHIGGAKPIPTALIGTADQIDYLKNFGINSVDNGEKPGVQTYPVCLIYQNDRYVIFSNATNILATTTEETKPPRLRFETRVLSLSRDKISGFQAVSGEYSEIQCGLSGALFNGRIILPASALQRIKN